MPQNSSQVRYLSINEAQQGQRIDNFLLGRLKGVPRSHVYRLLRTGQVRINGRRSRPKQRLCAGDEVRIPPWRGPVTDAVTRPPDALMARVTEAILYEDADLLVLNKPAGLAVHAGSGVRHGLIEALRCARGGDENLELAHRLDRDTSGCLLVARHRAMLLELHRLLRAGGVEKRYLALLLGRWSNGERVVDAPLARDRVRSGERMVEVSEDGGRRARSRFRPLACGERASLVEVALETGRTHQIRVHAAHVGHPVAGDPKYGDRVFNRTLRADGLRRMFLHAAQVSLPLEHARCPLQVSAPLPDDLAAVLERLRLTGPWAN